MGVALACSFLFAASQHWPTDFWGSFGQCWLMQFDIIGACNTGDIHASPVTEKALHLELWRERLARG